MICIRKSYRFSCIGQPINLPKRIDMPTPLFVILLVLFVGSAGVIIINLTGDPGIDYWDLDGGNSPPASRLDFLRTKPVFYSSGVVLIGSFIIYLLLR